jgi:receptor protein-tyrosine kinase
MEGKTTVLANLGIALAETRRRVLLIDADLRRPRLHRVFDICNDWGLTDMLQNPEFAGTAPLTSVTRATGVSNLWVMPSGPGAAAIPELLYSANLKALLKRARQEFDFVLIDSPPMLLYADGRVLGRMSDGIVMVVRANRVSREELRGACQRFLQDGIPVLGMVLNDWRMDRSQHSAYRDHYKHYRRSRSPD